MAKTTKRNLLNDGDTEMVDIDSLVPHPRNVNEGDSGAIHESIQQNGFWGTLIVQRSTRFILAGNHRAVVAKMLGYKELPVTWVDVDDRKALNILLSDNRTARLGTDNPAQLAELLQELAATTEGLDGTGYDGDDLDQLLKDLGDAPIPASSGLLPGVDPDAVPDNVPTRCKLGDLWRLGEHRLICGDSTDLEIVQRLMGIDKARCMWSDPPYGVSYIGKTKDALTIDNDGAEGLPSLLKKAFECADSALQDGGSIYIAGPSNPQCADFLNAFLSIKGWRLSQGLVWVKDIMVLGHSDYHYKHEIILYGFKLGEGRLGRGGERWYGDNSQVSVFEVDRPQRSSEHPTMKPILLITKMLSNSCKAGDIVYEPFAGSGSTLIACVELGLQCRAIELDPQYASVVLARWENATGQTAELVNG